MRVVKAPEQRRAELVAAARQLFDKNGVEKTRVSDIVKQVGVAQGVFYYYFASKEEIVNEVLDQTLEEITARRDAILSSRAALASRINAYVDLYIDWLDGFLADDAKSAEPLSEGSLAGNALLAESRTVLADGWEFLICRANVKGRLALRHPAVMARVLLLGLERMSLERLPGREEINAVLEQGLGLEAGALERKAGRKRAQPGDREKPEPNSGGSSPAPQV